MDNSIVEGILNMAVSGFLPLLFPRKDPKVSLVIPAYNEEKTIKYVIRQAKLVRDIKEIIVIDDGSRDKTSKIAEEEGVEVIKHHKNLGKGEAMKTGISHSKGSVILFLDADLKSITPKQIKTLIKPIIKDKADFTKASFSLKRGRITEFAVKPMMKLLYPEEKFKQPVSGQFAGKKSFFKNIRIEPRWGIDISILLEAIEKGQRVVEVELGELKHKARSADEKSTMSQEVMETILKKSGLLCNKHKVIFFSDKILFSNGFADKSELFLKSLMKKKIKVVLITSKGISSERKGNFDIVKGISSSKTPKKILSIAKRIAKKYSAELKDTVLITNRTSFESLAKKVDKAFCFEKSPESLKKDCKEILSPADVLMFLE